MTTRFIGSGRVREGGFGATHHQDFVAHFTGGDFRHSADQVDLLHPIQSLSATTTQQALEQLKAAISSSGSGFLSVGDGYTTFGSYNVGTAATPTFELAVRAATLDPRVAHGGIILIMAGSYTMTTPITLPVGITVMGEVAGTIISGTMVEQSMFIVSSAAETANVGGNSGSGTITVDVGSNTKKTRFYNIILADNLSGTSSTMTTVPMISVTKGATVEFERVTFLGKINNGTVLNRLKTSAAIGTIAGLPVATTINVKECFLDGIKQGIACSTSLGDKDFITISNTKARWFGKEGASYDGANDTLVSTTAANVTIENSYLVGAGTQTFSILYLSATGGTTANLRLRLTGITGSGTSSPGSIAGEVGFIVDNSASGITSINSVITGNNWGENIDNPWYIIIGGSNGLSPLGDIYGPRAIDTVLTYSKIAATVIVNPGTYTVIGSATSAGNFSNLKFIGNPQGNSYPIIQLNLQANDVLDNANNRFIVLGNHLEGLCFTSLNRFQSIRPSFSAISNTQQSYSNTLTVNDCLFTNTCLNLLPLSGGSGNDVLGNASQTITNISNCYFNQTATFNENISFIATSVGDITNLTNLYFKGQGYSIYVSATGSARSSFNLDRVFCNYAGTTVTNASPLASSHVYISLTNGSINIKNSEIICNTSLGSNTTLVASGLTNAGTYSKYTYFSAPAITATGNTINGPTLTYVSGGVTYSLPAAYFSPGVSFKLLNNHIMGGGHTQLSTTLNTTYFRENLLIQGNNFAGNNSITANNSTSLLAVDIDSAATTVGLEIIDNSFLYPTTTATVYPVQNVNVTGASYDSLAILQVYCRGVSAKVRGNTVNGSINTPALGSFNNVAGIYVNTFTSPSGSTTSNTSANVYDNDVNVINRFSSATATQTAAGIYAYTSSAIISGNNVYISNSSPSTNGCNAIYVNAQVVSSIGGVNITNNLLSRLGTNLSRGYIQIDPTTAVGGVIKENTYDSTTYNGASTLLVFLNNSAFNWINTNNKNQTYSIIVPGNAGLLGICDNTETVFYVGPGTSPLSIHSCVGFADSAYVVAGTDVDVQFYYDLNDGGSPIAFCWSIPLYNVLPSGSYLVSATVPLKVDSLTGLSTNSIRMRSFSAGIQTDRATLTPSTVNQSLTYTTSTQTEMQASLGNSIDIIWSVQGSNNRNLLMSHLILTARW